MSETVNFCAKKSKEQLQREIEECKSLSQLFELIQREHITFQMHSSSSASSLPPLFFEKPSDEISDKSPVENMKSELALAVEKGYDENPPQISVPIQPETKSTADDGAYEDVENPFEIRLLPKPQFSGDRELIKKLDECSTIGEVFDFVRREGIVIQMHSQTGASNVFRNAFTPQKKEQNPSTVARLRAEVRKAIENADKENNPPINESNGLPNNSLSVEPEKPTAEQIISNIDECSTVSEVLDYVREQEIELPLYSEPIAEALVPQPADPKLADKEKTPFARLKKSVQKLVREKDAEDRQEEIKLQKEAEKVKQERAKKQRLLKRLGACTTLSEVLEFAKKEKLEVEPFAKPDISYLYFQANTPKELWNREYTPFEKLRTKLRKAIENND